MDNPATPAALTARGYTGPAVEAVQQTRLDEAWRALRREPSIGQIEARIGVDLDTDDVIDVLAAAALRVLRNPEGVEEESGALDDYRESWKRSDASEDLYFTAAELRRLAPAAGAMTGFVGSIRYE